MLPKIFNFPQVTLLRLGLNLKEILFLDYLEQFAGSGPGESYVMDLAPVREDYIIELVFQAVSFQEVQGFSEMSSRRDDETDPGLVEPFYRVAIDRADLLRRVQKGAVQVQADIFKRVAHGTVSLVDLDRVSQFLGVLRIAYAYEAS